MNIEDLIKLGADKVRKSPSLMAIYISVFEKEFGKAPNCAGCSFSNDWQRLVNRLKKEDKAMNKNRYRLKVIENKILTYRNNGIPYRIYDYLMTDEFAQAFLKYGSQQELDQRKKLFYQIKEVNHSKESESNGINEDKVITIQKKRNRK